MNNNNNNYYYYYYNNIYIHLMHELVYGNGERKFNAWKNFLRKVIGS